MFNEKLKRGLSPLSHLERFKAQQRLYNPLMKRRYIGDDAFNDELG